MEKFSFKNDYGEGAHPKIIEALSKNNMIQQSPYGDDEYCISAKAKIITYLKNPNSQIHFVNGGTMANLLVISHFLKPFEAVVSATTGHINVHETGAIENTGHKVIGVESKDGKLNTEMIQQVLDSYTDEHKVVPKLVYISNSTELGTIYKLSELKALSGFCKERALFLYMDGARLAQAIQSPESDLQLQDISGLTDAFYIGGTKNGALFGEAIVINNSDLNEYFRYSMKQKGALLAKGRSLGLQFDALFTDELFFELGTYANHQAEKIVKTLSQYHIDFFVAPETNQLFPILNNDVIKELLKDFEFYIWEKLEGDKSAVRIVTSWATPNEAIDDFNGSLDKLLK